MLTLTHHPATTVCGTDEWEATYWLGSCSFATCVRACPLEACADALHNAVMWTDTSTNSSKRLRTDGDGFEHVGKPMILEEIFDEPPTDKIHADIAKEEAKLAEIQTKVFGAKCELDDLRRNNDAILKKLKACSPALYRIDDFIEGRITHFVVAGYGRVEILTKSAMIDNSDHQYDEAKTRMLCLFGRSNGDFAWKINTYSDGSGSWQEVIPCRSHEDATEEAKKYLLKELAERKSGGHYLADTTMKACELFGVPIPPDLMSRTIAMNIEGARSAEKMASEELAKCRKNLAELTAKYLPREAK